MRVMQVMAGGPVGGIETLFYDCVIALAAAGLAQFAVVRPNMPIHLARLKAAACLSPPPISTIGGVGRPRA